MAILELTLVPIGTKTTSLSDYVAKAYAIAKNAPVKVELTPMGTLLEGEVEELFVLCRKMQEAVFEAGAHRVYTVIKMDERRDRKASLRQKVRSVEEKL